MNAHSSSVATTTTTTVEAAAEALLMMVEVDQKIKKTTTTNFLKEYSLAPSIFNIKARRLAHCLYWMKLSIDKVYKVNF